MTTEEIRERTQGVWDSFYGLREIWGRSKCVPTLRGRLAFLFISCLLYTSPRQMERMLDAGAAAYLTKPLDIQKLLDAVDGAMRLGSPHDIHA